MRPYLVPLLMLLASCLMALAWLGHLRFRDGIGFWTALAASWAVVLPEYVINVAATRYGYGTYSGAQMATFHLAFGVVTVALVSRFVLGERLTTTQLVGFALLAVATVLICQRPQPAERADGGAAGREKGGGPEGPPPGTSADSQRAYGTKLIVLPARSTGPPIVNCS